MELSKEKVKILLRMEQIANAICDEFTRKDISPEEGIGGCMMFLARIAVESNDHENMTESLRFLILGLAKIKEIEEIQEKIKE